MTKPRSDLERAVWIAQHLFQMIDRETWRASGGDDMQGHYEGDYWAENIHQELLELGERADDMLHYTKRMLQALDCYWEHCEGLSDQKFKTVRSLSDAEDWWNRYEKYRAKVETIIRGKE